jgi:hypothetical protein
MDAPVVEPVDVMHRDAIRPARVVDEELQPVLGSEASGEFDEEWRRRAVVIAQKLPVQEHLRVVVGRAHPQEDTLGDNPRPIGELAREPGAPLVEEPLGPDQVERGGHRNRIAGGGVVVARQRPLLGG